MQKYRENLERELLEVEIDVLKENVKDFLKKNDFKDEDICIGEFDSWLDVRKRKALIAHFNVPDKKIYLIGGEYEGLFRDFRNFYLMKQGVSYEIIFDFVI